jgi:hypothetical protein
MFAPSSSCKERSGGLVANDAHNPVPVCNLLGVVAAGSPHFVSPFGQVCVSVCV